MRHATIAYLRRFETAAFASAHATSLGRLPTPPRLPARPIAAEEGGGFRVKPLINLHPQGMMLGSLAWSQMAGIRVGTQTAPTVAKHREAKPNVVITVPPAGLEPAWVHWSLPGLQFSIPPPAASPSACDPSLLGSKNSAALAVSSTSRWCTVCTRYIPGTVERPKRRPRFCQSLCVPEIHPGGTWRPAAT